LRDLPVGIFQSLAAALLLFAATVPAAAAEPLVFRGEVARGDKVIHRIEHEGTVLEFWLKPISHGWMIWIGDPARPEQNHATVATPPFRGVNPTRIEGWHFRNADNTGPNAPGPKNVNAPQHERPFAFFLDAASRRAALEALEILLWPDGRDEAEIKAAGERFAEIPKATAVLRVEALEFGNLREGERAWIERMAFSVKIDMPDKQPVVE
jgi:hypothetical protein